MASAPSDIHHAHLREGEEGRGVTSRILTSFDAVQPPINDEPSRARYRLSRKIFRTPRIRRDPTMSQQTTDQKMLTFIQYAQPQLEDGNYQIAVTQQVDSPTDQVPATVYSDTKGFTVRGERYALNPSEIVSVFPPEFSLGEFSNVLPHVVVNRKTLPWERSVGGDADAGNDAPWLGLIVFNEGDTIPEAIQKTALDLLPTTDESSSGETGKLPADTYFPPFPTEPSDPSKYVLDYGESWSDKVEVIDVDVATFNAIMPTLDDLGWLAHVRQVELKNKSEAYIATLNATEPASTPVGTVAEVVANRFPLADKKSAVHLVSLEGFGSVLPTAGGPHLDSKYAYVRLVSLKSWTFSSLKETHTFSGLLLNVNKPDGVFSQDTLQVPVNNSENEAVTNALNMGFAAFNHLSRMGDKMVSWYHGPFVPYDISTSLPFPGNTADDLTQYNPDSGMFDVSYSTAWQIGRLLALQNGSFASALYNWKRQTSQDMIKQAEQQMLDLTYAQIAALLSGSLANYVTPAAANATGAPTPSASAQHAGGRIAAIPELLRTRADAVRKVMTDPQQLSAQADEVEVPTTISNFLARLKLLYGLPFNYLVPDTRMLPQESLRFFYMDTAWADAVIEGAWSLGRSTSGDAALDSALSSNLHAETRAQASGIRRTLVAAPPEDDPPITPTDNPTGFLLRSQVVGGWPGLEVHGFDAGGTELDILRFDHVGPNVVLCIFNGVVQQVNIQQHPEALHFGVNLGGDDPSPAAFNKTFRYIAEDESNPPGKPVPTTVAKALEIKDYTRSTSSVLNIDALAKAIEAELSKKIQYSGDFTSAEFALEMIEGVQEVDFTFGS